MRYETSTHVRGERRLRVLNSCLSPSHLPCLFHDSSWLIL